MKNYPCVECFDYEVIEKTKVVRDAKEKKWFVLFKSKELLHQKKK